MVSINVGYALAQFERALESSATHADAAARARAGERAKKWRRVFEGMASGSLAVGSRTPTAAPAWATLEVLHGGFATGALAAGGELLAWERQLAARLGVEAEGRVGLGLHFLTDAGRRELLEMLASGRFRVDLPEEGALLVVAALVERGAVDAAAQVIDAIAPYLGEVRFYPRPSQQPVSQVSTVHVATVGETRAKLATLGTPNEVLRMNDSLAVWAPLTDRSADLLVEAMAHGTRGAAMPADWRLRAKALLYDHSVARAAHRHCKKPHHPKQNLAILVGAAAKLVDPDGTLSAREVGLVRVALAGHLAKNGSPDSAVRRARRAEQARIAALPVREESAKLVAGRLDALPPDGGLASLESVAGPFDDGPRAGASLFAGVVKKLERCLEASVEELVERGVLTSGEALARVLPQVSSHVRAMGFSDPELARLYAALDAAFRRRRSLLLLNYEAQVTLEELPWVAALEPFREDDGTSKEAARRLFARVTALALGAFPHAIPPNPLLTELRALAKRAGLEIPIVDELAADIFMGGFTAKFVRSAEITARRLEGTLYARYYALPAAEVRGIAARVLAPSLAQRARVLLGAPAMTTPTGGPVPAFGALCERMAGVGPNEPRSVALNGRVIEQQQILTSQNLVPLIDAAGLDTSGFDELARRTWAWLIRRAQVRVRAHVERLRTVKNVAYAWRQMIVYLSLAPAGTTEAFLAHAKAHLATQREPFRGRFAPLLAGLESAHLGETPKVRLLGWTTGPHPLLDPARQRR